jgi:hypothetical protein
VDRTTVPTGVRQRGIAHPQVTTILNRPVPS